MARHLTHRSRAFMPQLEPLEDRCVPADISVTGTTGNDIIVINELANTITVNEESQAPLGYAGADAHTYKIDGGKGGKDILIIIDGAGDDTYNVGLGGEPAEEPLDDDDVWVIDGASSNDTYRISTGNQMDTVKLDDNGGNDWYEVQTGDHNDNVTVNDGAGTDNYYIFTGDRNDTVTINDHNNFQAGVQTYEVHTGSGDDTVNITDAHGRDWYKVELEAGDDTLNVTDGFPGKDIYELSGGDHVVGGPQDDVINITDSYDDNDMVDLDMLKTFETITGAFD